MSLTCSAKGCQNPALWALLWNNPKLHTLDRRKSWLACDEHRTSLSSFLGARGFLREVEPVESSDRPADDRSDDGADGPADGAAETDRTG